MKTSIASATLIGKTLIYSGPTCEFLTRLGSFKVIGFFYKDSNYSWDAYSIEYTGNGRKATLPARELERWLKKGIMSEVIE